tara:strand:+ start:315 stop:575 length:261 start_codon:yes stop_codon:yes gene_type:complete
MSQIIETNAARLSSDDAQSLLNWRNGTNEGLVYGFTMQGLLDLYHLSSDYIELQYWLEENADATMRYKRISKSIHGPKNRANVAAA